VNQLENSETKISYYFTTFIQVLQLNVQTVKPKYDVTTNPPPEVLIWFNNQLHNQIDLTNQML